MKTDDSDSYRHPGKIIFEDKVDNRTWEEPIEALPGSMAWVMVDGKPHPVVKITITGTPEQRCITKFGPGDEFLETTIQAPPRGR